MLKHVLLSFVFIAIISQLAHAQLSMQKILTLTGENSGDDFGITGVGNCLYPSGDVNGDGIDDIVIGSRFNDAGGSDAGRVYIFFGKSSFAENIDASQADVIITGEASGDLFGISVSAGGDINADGIADIVIGANRNDAGGSNAGRVYIFWGSSSLSGYLDAKQANTIITGEGGLGISVFSTGDLNADGIDDLVIGTGASNVYVFWGNSFFADSLHSSQADVIIAATEDESYFGYSVLIAGDINSDGIDDLIISRQNEEAFAFWGGSSLIDHMESGQANWKITGLSTVKIRPAGDINVDGTDDLAIAGAGAHIFLGSTELSGTSNVEQADIAIYGKGVDGFGYSVSEAGDLNSDGISDLVVGAYKNSRAYIFFGAHNVTDISSYQQADIVITGEFSTDEFGKFVSAAGDVTGDGIDDLMIGAELYLYGGDWSHDAGTVHIFQTIGLSLNHPNGGEYLSGGSVREIKWVPINLSTIQHINLSYSLDSGINYPYEIVNNALNSGSYSWTVPSLDSDEIRVKAQAMDANNTLLAEDASDENFTIDSTSPTSFSLTFPTNGNWTLASPAFSWQAATDNLAGIGKYRLSIDGIVDLDSIPGSLTTTNPSFPLAEGFHTWNVTAIDRAGNERISNQTWTVRIDGSPPATFSLLTPEDGIWTNNTRPTFSWQASSDAGSGLQKYQLYIDGELIQDDISPSLTSITPTSTLNSADHSWYITAIDNAGNTQLSNETRTIRIDNSPPSAFSLTSPTNNAWTGDTTPTFSWQASSDVGCGLLKYELWIDGVVKIDSIPSNSTSVTLAPQMALANGNHTWYIKAYDNAYNVRQSNSMWTIKVDTISASTFSLQSPPDSSFANIPTPDFTWNSTTDAGSGLSHYQLWIDDALNLDNITSTTSSPGSPITEGPHSWFVRAIDNVGNGRKSDQTWIVYGEWNPPQAFDLASPPNGDTVKVSRPILSWHPSNDAGSGISKYQLWIDGLLNRDNIAATDNSAIPTSPLQNGIHNWFVKAFDRAMNSTSSTSIWQFIVDRDIAPPISVIIDPVQGQTIGGTSYMVKGTADDGDGSGVKVVHVSVDGGATWHEAQATSPNYATWQWEWTGYEQGSFTIKSRATDADGNVESPSSGVTVTVDISKPTVQNVTITPNPTSAGTIQISVVFKVQQRDLNYSAIPSVRFTPHGGSAIPFVQSSYSQKNWRGTGTVAATENNGTAIISVSGATDEAGNLMAPNPNAGSFEIDTHVPQAFDLISPANNGWVNSSRPTFSWGAANDAETGIGKYQLWIDNALKRDNISANSNTTTPVENLSLGEHEWFIRAFDLAGNSKNSSSINSFNMDFQSPICQITAPVQGDTLGGTSYSIRGTANDGAGHVSGVYLVDVSINNGEWRTAVNTGTDFNSWSYEFTGYSTGIYTIKSRATDRAGNVGNPSSPITVYVNASAPKVKNIVVTPELAKAGSVEIQIIFEVNKSGLDNSTNPVVAFKPASSNSQIAINQVSYEGNTWIGSSTITGGMNNGTAVIQVSDAKDNYGNIMSPNNTAGSFIIDTVAPIVRSIIASPDPAKVGNINFTATFEEATSGLDGASNPLVSFTPHGGNAVSVTQTGYNTTAKNWTGTAAITSDMNDGPATIQVQAGTDLAGNVMTANGNAGSFLIDVTPPTAFNLIAPQDSEWVAQSRPTLKWNTSSDAASGLLKYQLFINENLNIDNIVPTKTSILPAADLTEGAFLWYIMAYDSALNSTRSSSTRLLQIDTTPPISKIVNLTSGMSVSGDTVVIEGIANDGIGKEAGVGVDSVFVTFDGGTIWHPTLNTGMNFDTWQYLWTGFENKEYNIKSKAVDKLHNTEAPGEGTVVTQIEIKPEDLIPTEFALLQNYPNPFNPETVIRYQIPKASHVSLKVYNALGCEINSLVDDEMNPGYQQVIWNGKDNLGNNVGTGIYLYRMTAGDFVEVRKMIKLQ